MDLGLEVANWFLQNLSGIVFLILGSFLGFLGSWLTARYTRNAQITEEERRKVEHHKELWKQSLADLIGELQQNQQHQSLDKWIMLETSAYHRFRSQGLVGELDPNLQLELRRLYSHIRRKNDWTRYYQTFIPSLPMEQRNENALTLLKKIDEAENEVVNRIFQILPTLLELQKKT
jgi:hypothetical protein